MVNIYKIITLSEEYAGSLARLEEECFSTPWSEKMLSDDIKNPNTCYCAAVDEGKVIGYAGMWVSVYDGQITNVAVTKEYRRQNVATALVSTLCDLCVKKGLECITLEVRKANLAAISLYKKLGFETVGVRKNYYKNPTDDAILMTKFFNDREDEKDGKIASD